MELISNKNLALEQSTPQSGSKTQFFSSWSHKPGFAEACILTLLLATTAGILKGYPESLEVIIMVKGASYSDQAVLSLNIYPYMFKILFAPLVDRYYIRRLGKAKTLVSISGTALFLLMILFGVHSEDYIDSNSVWVLTILWFIITIFAVMIQLGAEIWSLTLFEGEMKYVAGILAPAGMNFGRAIGYNLFVLLNSTDWWNENVFKNSSWELETEIVTHKGFIRGVALLILGTTFYCMLFAREKAVESSRTKTWAGILKTAQNLLQIPPIVKMIAIFVLYQLFFYLFSKSVELKFIEYDVDKASLVNIQSAVLPLKLILMALVPFFALKTHLMRQVLGFQVGTLLGVFILLVLVWTLRSGSDVSSLWMMAGFLLRDFSNISRQLIYSKITQVIPEDIGATGYTIFSGLSNISQHVPSSIGLKLADLVSEKRFFGLVLASILIQFAVICFLWPLASQVDNAKIDEFRILSESEEQID